MDASTFLSLEMKGRSLDKICAKRLGKKVSIPGDEGKVFGQNLDELVNQIKFLSLEMKGRSLDYGIFVRKALKKGFYPWR